MKHYFLENPVLPDNRVNYGTGSANAGYHKEKEGRVHLRESIKSGTNPTLFELPPDYRSSGQLFFLVVINFNPEVLRILTECTEFLCVG